MPGAKRREVGWVPYGRDNGQMLDEVGLVHMNGRIYDPLLGKFLSPDPFVQSPANGQSYNRYAYGWNNPLSITDPSGYFVGLIGGLLGIGAAIVGIFKPELIKPILAIAVSATLAVLLGPGAFGITGLGWNGFVVGAIAGAAGGGITGGARGAIFGALSGAVGGGIGEFFQLGSVGEALGGLKEVARAMAHGVSQGGISELAGGEFITGFASGALSAAATHMGPDFGEGFQVGELMMAAAVGGTVSEITGGDFANGAITGSYGYLFNQVLSEGREQTRSRSSNRRYGPDRVRRAEIRRAKIEGLIAGIEADAWKALDTAVNSEIAWAIEGASMGALAFIDGAIDIVPLIELKPFESFGFYDSQQYGLDGSQLIGALTRDAALVLGGAAAWRSGTMLGVPLPGVGTTSMVDAVVLSGVGVTTLSVVVSKPTVAGMALTVGSRVSTAVESFDYFFNDE